MLHTDMRAWTDLLPQSTFRNRAPNVIITADEIANGEWDGLLGDSMQPGFERRVVYVDTTVTPAKRWVYDLVLYIHPVGTGALTIYAAGASTCRGKIMAEDGAYTVSKEDNTAMAGGMLSHYAETSGFVGSGAQNPAWSTQIADGDAIWLVRKGNYEALCDSDGAVAANSNLVVDNSNGVAGAVQNSVGTISNLAEVMENVGGLQGKSLGRALEAGGATNAGYAEIELDLPLRWTR